MAGVEAVPSVLFVCNLNRVRSPMAAALMRRRYGPAVIADSCGLEPADSVDPFVAGVLYELDIDVTDYEPKALNAVLLADFDLVVALTPEAHAHAEALCGRGPVEYWPTSDPTGVEGSRDQRVEAYRATRGELERRLTERFG